MAIPAISQRYKIDLGLVGQTINGSNATGPYFPVAGYRKFLAVCIDGASVLNKTTQIEWLQATALAGTGAKVVKQSNITTGTESKAVSTAGALTITKATEITIDPTDAANGDTIVVNGVTFTAHTNATTAAKREFKIDGTDAQDATALYGLLIHATYGITGLGIAVTDDEAGLLTLRALGDDTTLTVVSSNATRLPIAITKQILYSEIDIDDLDISGGFVYVAPKVTKAGNGIVSVVVLREVGDYGPAAQQVASSTLI